jgi:hypothetical protein
MVTTMAKKKVILIFDSLPKYRMSNTAVLWQGVRIIVTVECTESKAIGATPSRYCTQKVRKDKAGTDLSIDMYLLGHYRLVWRRFTTCVVIISCGSGSKDHGVVGRGQCAHPMPWDLYCRIFSSLDEHISYM